MIAVHCGAGNHANSKHEAYKKLTTRACRAGISILQKKGTALEAIQAAIKVLEDDPLTNAGYGSNLTTSGVVECDASVMDGTTLLYGGCGATTTVKNPIELAYDLCLKQRLVSTVGLIAPSLLVGTGADRHAKKNGLRVVSNKRLISKSALKLLKKYKKVLESENKVVQSEDRVLQSESNERMDTVGAVCYDIDGNVAAGCSSGGLLLKTPGRIGQGALYASGVWADSFDKNDTAVAATTSGSGEHLVKTQLAKVICDDLKSSCFPTPDLSKCLKDKFIDSRLLHNVEKKSAGALVLHVLPEGQGTLLWGHTTNSMSVGYMALEDSKPKSLISKLQAETRTKDSVMVGGTNFLLKSKPNTKKIKATVQ